MDVIVNKFHTFLHIRYLHSVLAFASFQISHKCIKIGHIKLYNYIFIKRLPITMKFFSLLNNWQNAVFERYIKIKDANRHSRVFWFIRWALGLKAERAFSFEDGQLSRSRVALWCQLMSATDTRENQVSSKGIRCFPSLHSISRNREAVAWVNWNLWSHGMLLCLDFRAAQPEECNVSITVDRSLSPHVHGDPSDRSIHTYARVDQFARVLHFNVLTKARRMLEGWYSGVQVIVESSGVSIAVIAG